VRSKLISYAKITMIIIYLAMLVCCVQARADEPDEISILRGDDPATEVLVVKWGDEVYKLRVKGRIADKKNEEAVMQWMADRTDEHLDKASGK